MANINAAYGSPETLDITLDGLASDTNFLTGRESDAITNVSNLYLDYLLTGFITTGTTPTAGREIRVYVVGIQQGSTWPSPFDGTDSDETLASAGARDGICRLAFSIVTSGTSDFTYNFGPISVRGLFGQVLPSQFVVFVTQGSGVNLNATGGTIYVTPYYETIT